MDHNRLNYKYKKEPLIGSFLSITLLSSANNRLNIFCQWLNYYDSARLARLKQPRRNKLRRMRVNPGLGF